MINFLVRSLKVFTLFLVITSPYLVTSVNAEDKYICEAKQNSNNELPVLSKSCPIGKGLWGKAPREDSGLFWIQCGLFSQPISLPKAKSIYSKITSDVWMKPEEKGYRCLIGPYERYTLAQKELKQVRTLKPYRKAFIRSVAASGAYSKASNKAKPKAKPQPKPKKVAPTASPKPVTPVAKKKVKKTPKVESKKQIMKGSSAGAIVLRREAKVGERYYAIPFLMEGNDQYYMEYAIGWNRLSYAKAKMVCESQQMRLVNDREWKDLIDSKVMIKKQWPIHVPYWGEGKKGFFSSGKVTQLTGTSLLNIVCVK